MSNTQSAKKRVGIFAGTFDPIHNGHLAVARLSREQCLLDTVYFAVEAEPWGIKNPVGFDKRKVMVDLAISTEENISQIKLPQKRFDIETTLPYLEKVLKGTEIYFIFGADVFMKMSQKSWPGLDKLLNHNFIIFERGDIDENDINKKAKELDINTAILTSEHLGHSSSRVRTKSVNSDMLPESVAKYVSNNGFYLNKPDTVN